MKILVTDLSACGRDCFRAIRNILHDGRNSPEHELTQPLKQQQYQQLQKYKNKTITSSTTFTNQPASPENFLTLPLKQKQCQQLQSTNNNNNKKSFSPNH